MSNSTRSSNSYDERYVVPLEASRRGAHRARVSPVMAALPVIAVVGIVVGAIALVYVFFGKLGGGSDSATQTTASSPSTTAMASTSPTASASATQEPAMTSSPAGVIDKAITVSVYNATMTQGLARKAGNKLAAAGWTLGPVQSWTGGSVTTTTIYYGSAQHRATALSIARSLGRGVVKLSASKAGTGIAVVIGLDYPGAGGTRTHSSGTSRSTAPGGMTRSPTTAPMSPAGTPSMSPAN